MSHVDPNCQHGMLRRGCDLCEMIVQNADLRARVAEAETYRKFWQRYAMPPKARPSCLVCGRVPEDWPPAIEHMALPSVIVCAPCVTAVRDAGNKPASLPEGT